MRGAIMNNRSIDEEIKEIRVGNLCSLCKENMEQELYFDNGKDKQIKSLIGKRLSGEIHKKVLAHHQEDTPYWLKIKNEIKGYNRAIDDIRKVFKDVLNIGG